MSRRQPYLCYVLLLGAGILALAWATSVGAEGQAAQLQAWLRMGSAELAPQVRAALTQISGADRQLLALRSYLRAGDSLSARWSWSADKIAAYPHSAEGKAANAALDAVSRAFTAANPGYQLQVNRQPRSLETQIAHWNENPSVGRAAQTLARALEQQFSGTPMVGVNVLRAALNADRVTPGWIDRQGRFNPDVVNPAVAEIVFVGKPLHPAQFQIANPYLSGVRFEKHATLTVHSVFTAEDLKTVQVHIFPAESDLQYLVKLRDTGVARNQQPSPD